MLKKKKMFALCTFPASYLTKLTGKSRSKSKTNYGQRYALDKRHESKEIKKDIVVVNTSLSLALLSDSGEETVSEVGPICTEFEVTKVKQPKGKLLNPFRKVFGFELVTVC
jgi:hypothetical protein